MVYTHRSPALLVIAIVMLLWGWLNQAGQIDGLQGWLHPSAYKQHKECIEKHKAAVKEAADKAAAERDAADRELRAKQQPAPSPATQCMVDPRT